MDAGYGMAGLASQIQIGTIYKNCLDLENLNKKTVKEVE